MFRATDKTEEIINLIWNCDEYYLVVAGKDAPSAKVVKSLAARFGVNVPREFVAHATGYWGSPYLEIKEEVWPRHKAYDVGPFWSFLYGLFVYAYSDWMKAGIAAQEFKEMGHTVLPILKIVGDADVYCFDQNGKIQRWLHEENRFEAIGGNFFDLLRYEFLELDDRRKRKKAESDSALNRSSGARSE